MEKLKIDPTEFTYLKKDKKTIEELEEEELPKYLEKEELARFLSTAKTQGLEMDYIIFLTLSYTGLRVGELVSLKWKDIDFDLIGKLLVFQKLTTTQQIILSTIS